MFDGYLCEIGALFEEGCHDSSRLLSALLNSLSMARRHELFGIKWVKRNEVNERTI